jgi:hypothetical protein
MINTFIQFVGNAIYEIYSRWTNEGSEKAQFDNYTIRVDNLESSSIKLYQMNPSLFELSASRVAHYLFPKNFAEYSFLITPNMDIHSNIPAGYFSTANVDLECDGEYIEGVENVYATAFYMGLEILSDGYAKSGDKTYLFIDDFTHPFHRLDAERKTLIAEFRDHKIVHEEGTLFPTSLMNKNCGEWINKPCNIEKLKAAYENILSVPQDKIRSIVDTAIAVLQSIECHNQDDICKSDTYYQLMQYYAGVLDNNYLALSSIMKSYNHIKKLELPCTRSIIKIT